MSANSYHGKNNLNSLLQRMNINRGMMFAVILITALLAFEMFNYSTTDFALTDLLGDLSFAGLRWATILSIAFCGIDFAGIARLFTPEGGENPSKEVWYLFGAWMLAAVMNALLTWWGVSIAILNNGTLGNAVIERATLLRIVPVFVAVLVWLIRVLIIGTFSVAGDRLFATSYQNLNANQHQAPQRSSRPAARPQPRPTRQAPISGNRVPTPRAAQASRPSPPKKLYAAPDRNFAPAPKPEPEMVPLSQESEYNQNEFSYHPHAQVNSPAPTHKRARTDPALRSWPSDNRRR